MSRGKSYPTDSSSEFDRLMSSPEAAASRVRTLASMKSPAQGNHHETPEKSFPDISSCSVSAGKGEIRILRGLELSEAIAQLPREVQDFLARKPQHIQDILNGRVIPESRSNGAGDVSMLVSRSGIEVVSCIRDC